MWKLMIFFLCLNTAVSAQLSADFSATITKGCTPLIVQFNDASTGSPTQWFWDFGNGITSYSQNPVITYSISGSYTVRLIVRKGSEQTYKEKTNYIIVSAVPVVDFDATVDSGCAPLQTDFFDASGFPANALKSWLWDFGDGTTSTQQNASHLYTAAGKYDVSLLLETVNGCTAQLTKYNLVKAGNKPTADFSASPLSGCASTFRNFKNQSAAGISGFVWDFGDGGFSNERNPEYHFQDTGKFNVKLIVSNNGCKDSTEKKNYVSVYGALAKFKTIIDCNDRYTLQFLDKSISETGRIWNFGDGQTLSTTVRPSHTYSDVGKYIVSLIVNGTSCNDTAYDAIYIKTGNPSISVTPVKNAYCKKDTLNFVLTGYDSSNTKAFKWNFGDSIIPYARNNDSVNYIYKKNGSYRIKAFINNNQGCNDSLLFSQPININGPTANFATLNGCTNSSISFTDQSVSGKNQPINQWLWSYGDGTTSTGKTPLNYTYIFPGVYNVNLKVTDVSNCSDTITKPIEIFNSPTVTVGNDTLICAANKLMLNASGATDYLWNANADLSCTTCANPVATPNQQATYIVTGTSNGCSDSDSINVNVITKQTITAQPDSYTLCAGDTVSLNVSGADRFSWSPSSSLSSSVSATPLAFPSQTTVYTVVGNDNLNCFADSALISVNVNPKPTVDITNNYVQLITGSQYTILPTVSGDAQNLQWVPATGLSCSNCLQPTTTVYNTASYTLYATNSFGCSDSAKITLYAICTDQSVFIPNTFSPNNDGMNDYFYPRSQGDPVIKSFSIFNRLGQIVFQKRNIHANDPGEGWDGTNNNKIQSADVYVYVMEIQCSGNKPFVKKGSINLVR